MSIRYPVVGSECVQETAQVWRRQTQRPQRERHLLATEAASLGVVQLLTCPYEGGFEVVRDGKRLGQERLHVQYGLTLQLWIAYHGAGC
ncbi:hypothetical protein AaE_008100, partial [Aphanomyces astaci]